ncbi:hypothetical protein PR001_g17739 [Phytophthora rubi]|nr:hypothetical protein PR001_g17739 [Phytophthora rubi]
MTDADKAQYKASRNELPSSRVLMCWYHVTANVYNLEETDKFFEDLYDLHYVPEDEFADLKTEILARWAALPAGSAAFKMGCYVKKVVDLWEVLRLAGFPDSKRLSCNKQPA